MNAKPAVVVFLGICIVLAGLLLLQLITPVDSGAVFVAYHFSQLRICSAVFRKASGGSKKTENR